MKKIVLSILAFSALNATAQIPTNGLLERFTFDNTLNGVNGTFLNGTANYQSDRNGNTNRAHWVDSSQNTFSNISMPFPNTQAAERTVAFWFQHETNSTHSFFTFRTGEILSPTSFFVLYNADNLIYGSQNAGTVTSFSTPLPYSTHWTHIAITYNGTQLKAYIDGSLAATVNHTVPNILPAGVGNIGRSPNYALQPDFYLDDLLIYNRALSDTEISQIYNDSPSASIEDGSALNTLEIYPNPTNGLVNISNIPAGTVMKVSDATGRVVATQISEANTTSIDFSNQENGVYFVSFQNTLGASVTKKLIVRK